MALSGSIHEGEWSVRVATSRANEDGYSCTIHVSQVSPTCNFEHDFLASRNSPTEREAVLEGLREGMTWIELKRARIINV